MSEHRGGFAGEHEPLAGALKQRLSDCRLQRSQTATHRRLGLAEMPGGGAERSLARNRKKYPEIAPLQHDIQPKRKRMNSVQYR